MIKMVIDPMPKLSVIVPVYNTEKYIRECIDSVLAQTFTDFELILVDDGSTDGSGVICDEYADKDPRIKVIHQENGGATAARRNGVNRACGGYIAFVDSDDWISQNMYQDMMRKAGSFGADMVLCDMVLEKQKGHAAVQSSRLSGFFAEEQLEQQIYGELLFNYAENGPGLSLSLCNKLIKAPLVRCALATLPDEITYGEDAIGSLICMLEAKYIYIMKGFAGYHYRQTEAFACRERCLSLLPRLSDFAKIMQQYLAKYAFIGDDQLAGYVAQVSLYCIRHILLFNADHTIWEKLSAVKQYSQEPHIRKLLTWAESLVVDWKMKKKLKLLNRKRYFLLLMLFVGREIIMFFQRCLDSKRDKR